MAKIETVEATRKQMSTRDRCILALLIAIITCISSHYLSKSTGMGIGDLRYSIWLARDYLAGKDPYLPYKLNTDPFAVPYPFTAVILSLPFAWLPDRIAAAIFTGLGSGILAWLILKRGKSWQLMIFASWPFVNSLLFTQWCPYVVSMFFTPNFLPFLFTKPQLALPFVLTQKPNRIGVISAGLLLVISLILYPLWPIDWVKTLHNYIGYPPLFVLPLGPLLLLALLRYREKRSWLLVLLALMPQRMVYDQLGVLLVAENRKQMLFLVLCSWITLPILVYYGGWYYVPWGWQQWVLIESYLPALIVIVLPYLNSLLIRSKLKLSN
jgi:hypothetical protein